MSTISRAVPQQAAGRQPATAFRPGPLGRLGRLAFRHRGRTVLVWLIALGIVFGLSTLFAGKFDADYSAPGSDSRAAQQVLTSFPVSGSPTVEVVARSGGSVTDPATRQQVEHLLAEAGKVPHVNGFGDPYRAPGAISTDGRTLVASLQLDVARAVDLPHESALSLIQLARTASTDGLTVAVTGESIVNAEAGEIGSEGIGIIAAALILLLMFGSVVAAGLPIIVAVAGLAVSSMVTGLIAALLPVPDWSTSLATMIGIGIGIDYALLMVTRFREWRAAGLSPEQATVATMDTAGRSVLLAGSTVVISMLGLFGMGLSFMRGAALVTIAAIVIVLASAITLFPALLGYFGKHIDRLRIPLPRRSVRSAATGTGWLRWSRFVQRHRIPATLAGLAALLAIAAPFLGVHFGFPDSGNGRMPARPVPHTFCCPTVSGLA